LASPSETRRPRAALPSADAVVRSDSGNSDNKEGQRQTQRQRQRQRAGRYRNLAGWT